MCIGDRLESEEDEELDDDDDDDDESLSESLSLLSDESEDEEDELEDEDDEDDGERAFRFFFFFSFEDSAAGAGRAFLAGQRSRKLDTGSSGHTSVDLETLLGRAAAESAPKRAKRTLSPARVENKRTAPDSGRFWP